MHILFEKAKFFSEKKEFFCKLVMVLLYGVFSTSVFAAARLGTKLSLRRKHHEVRSLQ